MDQKREVSGETRPETERMVVDAGTAEFIRNHPLLTAKLLHLRGMTTFRQPPGTRDTDHLARQERHAYTERSALYEYVRDVEATLVETLEQGHPDADRIADAALLWRHGFPPYADDFSPEEREIIDHGREGSPFVHMAAELVPMPLTFDYPPGSVNGSYAR